MKRIMSLQWIVSAAWLLILAAPAHASMYAFDFETGLQGWSYYGSPGYSVGLSSGNTGLAAYISGDGCCNQLSGMAQDFAINPGSLSIALDFRALSTHENSHTSQARIQLLDPDTSASLYGEVFYPPQSCTSCGPSDSGWQSVSPLDLSAFVPTQTSVRVFLQLADSWVDNYSQQTWFDNVAIASEPQTAPVPEPSTWLLLGSGLMGLAAWRRR